MKIEQLLSKVYIPLTNEERDFVNLHKNHVVLSSLDEHDNWVAQKLVRKGIYAISKDNNTLLKKTNEPNTR